MVSPLSSFIIPTSFKIAFSLDNPKGRHPCWSNLFAHRSPITWSSIYKLQTKLWTQLCFCLTLDTSFMAASPLELWVDGQEIQPGVIALSGSFHMSAITDQQRPVASCHATLYSSPRSPGTPCCSGHCLGSWTCFYHNSAVECKRKQADIPLNIVLGHVRSSSNAYSKAVEEAAENTAAILTDSWINWVVVSFPATFNYVNVFSSFSSTWHSCDAISHKIYSL